MQTLKSKEFDPLAYIESAFLDTNPRPKVLEGSTGEDIDLPSIGEFLNSPAGKNGTAEKKTKFRKTEMSAPRPRRAKSKPAAKQIDPEIQETWEALPKNIRFLAGFFDDGVTANYYGGEFKETREELIRRLLDPRLTLEETSRLLGVCPATVRRYTNRGWLQHHRTDGGQRRFRLSDVVQFVDEHGRFPEE